MEHLISDDYDRHLDDEPYKDTRAQEALKLLLILLTIGLGLYFVPMLTVGLVVGSLFGFWLTYDKNEVSKWR